MAEQIHSALAVEQVECADARALDTGHELIPVGQRIHLRVAKDPGRVQGGEHGGRKVRGGRHDVCRDQRLRHHVRMQVRVIFARAPVACHHGLVGGRQQRSGAARQVGDAQGLDLPGVPPVELQGIYRQLGEQGGRGWQRIEGRQELAIHDQLLEHPPVQIMGAGDT